MANRRVSVVLGILFLGVILLSLSCNIPIISQSDKNLSQEEALQLVLDEIVKPDELGEDPLVIFAWPEPLVKGDSLHPYNFHGEEPIPDLIEVESESWFFWIDDLPYGRFSHPTRYVLVDIKSAEISDTEQEWWPVLNTQGLWTGAGEYEDEENWAWSNVTFEEGATSSNKGASSVMAPALPIRQESSQTEGGKRRALVINTYIEEEIGEDNGVYDANNMIGILEKNDFETTYLGTDYDNNPKKMGKPFLPYPNPDPWKVWLQTMSEVMNPGDTLVVYISGHGNQGFNGRGEVGGKKGTIFGNELRDELQKFKPCVDIIVIIDSCKSGSFTEALKDVADLTMTASSATRYSLQDMDFWLSILGLAYTDLNPFDEGGEYTSSLVAGWEEIMEDPELMETVKTRAYEEGRTFMQALISQAYAEGEIYDLAQRWIRSNPQTSYGSEKSHCEAGSGVSLPDPTPTPTITPSPTPEPTPTPEETEGTCAVFEDLEIEKTIMRHMRDCNPTLNFYYKLDIPVPGLATESPSPWDYSVLVNGKEGDCFLEEGFNDRLYCRVEISPDEAYTLGHFELFANPCQEPISVLDLTIPELEGCGEHQTESEEPDCDS